MDFLSNILPLACGLQATVSFQVISPSPLGMLRSWPALLDILENPYKNSHLYWPQLCSNRGWKGSRGARLGKTGYAPSPGSLWFPPREKGLFPSFCLFARLCLAASHWLSPLLGLAPWTSGSQVLRSQDSLCPLTGYWGPQRALVYVCFLPLVTVSEITTENIKPLNTQAHILSAIRVILCLHVTQSLENSLGTCEKMSERANNISLLWK